MSSTLEDHIYVNRFAIVQSVPFAIDSQGVKPGDIVVVHHNTFRKMYDVKGNMKDSLSFFRDNIFLVEPGQVYLAKSGDEDWRCVGDYAFVSPVKNDNKYDLSAEKLCFGNIEFSNELEKGTLVSFQPDCEYEFRIDERKMYRMYNKNICLKA